MYLYNAIFLAMLACSTHADVLLGTNDCLKHTDCRRTDYCDKPFLSSIGKCVLGKEDGGLCKDHNVCASKHCALLQCKSRTRVEDGPCKESAHCLDNQYCNELKTCVDQKCGGSCMRDDECASTKCTFLKCTQTTKNNCSGAAVPQPITHTIVTTNITTIITNVTKV